MSPFDLLRFGATLALLGFAAEWLCLRAELEAWDSDRVRRARILARFASWAGTVKQVGIGAIGAGLIWWLWAL